MYSLSFNIYDLKKWSISVCLLEEKLYQEYFQKWKQFYCMVVKKIESK